MQGGSSLSDKPALALTYRSLRCLLRTRVEQSINVTRYYGESSRSFGQQANVLSLLRVEKHHKL
jgi:hypothetical protein